MTEPLQEAELEPQIRNAVRAVIVREGAVLMQKKWEAGRGVWYTLPGGGQEVHETLVQALERECEEEIGVRVEIDRFMALGDFFKRREATHPTRRHLIEYYFACRVSEAYRPTAGPHPDKHQVDVVWLPIGQLSELALFPRSLGRYLPALAAGDAPGYLGVIDQEL